MKGRSIEYLPEELEWIEANKTLPREQMWRRFCFLFQRQDVSKTHLAALCKRKGWLTGRTGCFEKGQVPLNKGKTIPLHPNSAATRFKKGQRPVNKLDVGAESIDRDGYVKICVAEPNRWTGAPTHMAFKHRWLWEKANGPVPAGHALKCLDGNKRNCDPSNWEAVPRGLLPRLNGKCRRDYDRAPAELKPTILTIAKLEHAARAARAAQHRQPAQMARVTGLTHVRVADLRMTVLEAEGTVQLVVAREGDAGSFTTFFNEFCDSATAGQLRQLADAVAAAWEASAGGSAA